MRTTNCSCHSIICSCLRKGNKDCENKGENADRQNFLPYPKCLRK